MPNSSEHVETTYRVTPSMYGDYDANKITSPGVYECQVESAKIGNIKNDPVIIVRFLTKDGMAYESLLWQTLNMYWKFQKLCSDFGVWKQFVRPDEGEYAASVLCQYHLNFILQHIVGRVCKIEIQESDHYAKKGRCVLEIKKHIPLMSAPAENYSEDEFLQEIDEGYSYLSSDNDTPF